MPPSVACRWRDAAAYLPVQTVGCIGGAILANVMFSRGGDLDLHHSTGPRAPHWLSEVVATIGLILVIFALARSRSVAPGPGRGRGLHRRGLLLHQLDQLRQPGHHRRPDVLRHLRRHRPVLGPELRLGPGRGWGARLRAGQASSTPASPLPKRPTSSSPTTEVVDDPTPKEAP